ncbi:monocarboxylate transporter 12 [Clonorchis sinensis]|uniref:Monocarboxylate transporter 12 n=1 Tax=Clonorchis sinensis TaxID=79923 RepID=G7Y8J6_CLOSI|nr:monocarboxylate transporter 12 [Clonorchis sinensis]
MSSSGEKIQLTTAMAEVEPNVIGRPDPASENIQTSDHIHGSLTQSEAERLQREANEDTTRSEDLRLFLKEMHEKLKEEQQQQQQQPSTQPATTIPPVFAQPTNVSESEYSLSGHPPSVGVPTRDLEGDVQPAVRRSSGPMATKLGNPPNRIGSVTDLTNPDTAPDGGWGWVVVLGSFCCMILVDGVSLSYGLLLTPQCGYSSLHVLSPSNNLGNRSLAHLKTGVITRDRPLRPTFGSCAPISELGEAVGTQSRAILLTPGALLLGLYLILGPLVSALTNQFDFRPVAMAGAVLSTVAFLISAFANSIDLLIGGFGVLGGIGFALIYLPAIATVGHWFQQSRPLAVGLALCGSGVGCLLGAQAVPRLVDWLTWRGALIVMAATSFQALSLIVLFRPLEVHFRICQAQRLKRAAREAARRDAAMRRAEAELRLMEARQRKRLSAAKVAAAQAMEYQQKIQYQQQQYRQISGMKPSYPSTVMPQLDARTGAMLQTHGMLRGTANRPRMGTMVTRTGRGGRMFTVTTAANQQGSVVVGVNPTRSTTGAPPRGGPGWLRSRNQSGRNQAAKRAPSRRVVVYRGSIMQRIIEEKRRQRTTSVGSLDGMVITRDNELIAAPLAPGYDRPLLSASVINRISESVARKIELKMQQQQTGVVSDITGGSRVGLSRSHLRVNLPQVVQEYIQSQLSVVQHKQSMNLMNPSTTGLLSSNLPPQVSTASTVVPMRPTSIVEPPGSSQVDTSVNAPPVSPVAPIPLVADDGLVLSPEHSTPVNPSPSSLIPTSQTGPVQELTQAPIVSLKHPHKPAASSCTSESTSLRHTISDASLESRVPVNGGGTAVVAVPTADAVELLDDEIKAHINARLRRELARPQHKKDLFYTGSVLHLGSGQVTRERVFTRPSAVMPPSLAASGGGALKRHVSSVICPSALILSSNTGFKMRGLRTSVAVTPQPTTVEPAAIESHNSQTNISVATSIGTGGTTFIPPAPCPTIPPTQVPSAFCLPPSAFPVVMDTTDACSFQQQDTVLTNFAPSGQLDTRVSVQDEQASLTVLQPSRGTTYTLARSAEPLGGDAADLVSRLGDVENEELDMEDDDLDVVDDADDDDVDEEEVDDEDDEVGGGFYGLRSVFHNCYACTLASFWCTRCCSKVSNKLSPMRTFLQELFSPWILSSRTFLFMLLSSMTTMMGYVIPFLLLPDLLAELNWTLADSGFAISAIGVGNTVGRLVATVYIEKAWWTTYTWANCLWLNNASLLITSLAVFIMPVLRTHYTSLVLICLVFGFCSAVFVSLKSILVVELLGLERLTNSFGYMLLFQGLAAGVGPPVAGILRDLQLDQYAPHDILTAHLAPVHNAASMGFYFSGVCLFLSCLLGCPLRWLSRAESSRSITVVSHPSSTADPPFELITGPRSVPDTAGTVAAQVGDVEFLIGLPEQTGVINFAASISDNFNPRVSELVEQKPFANNTNAEPATGVPLAATVVGQPPTVGSSVMTAVSASGAAPNLVELSGPPCILATINEDIPVVTAPAQAVTDVVLPTVPATNTDDISMFDGLPASILPCALVIPSAGVTVPVVTGTPCATPGALPSQTATAVEVLGVQEDSGLEPVAEEEEDEYDNDDVQEPEIPYTSFQTGPSNGRFEVLTVPDSSPNMPTSEQPDVSDQSVKRRKKRRKVAPKLHNGSDPSSVIVTTAVPSGSDESGQHSQQQGSTDQSGSSIQSQVT